MTRVVKRIAVTLSAIFLLLVLAISLLVALVNPNDYKESISKEISKSTGRQLQINGNLAWDVFPWIGVEVNQVVLGNATGFTGQAFASIDHAKVTVRFLPALIGQIKIGHLNIDGFKLNLTKHADGKANWDDLINTPSEKNSNKKSLSQHNTEPRLSGFGIANVNIKNADIGYQNQQTNQTYQIQNFGIKAKQISFTRPFPFQLQLNLQQKQLSAKINLKSQILLDLAHQRYQLDDLVMTSQLVRLDINRKIPIKLDASLDVDLKAETFDLSDLYLSLGEMSVSGELSGKSIFSTPQLAGVLKTNTFDLRTVLRDLGQPAPSPQKSNAYSKVKITTQFSDKNKKLNLNKLAIRLDESNIKGNISLINLTNPRGTFNLSIDQLNLDDYQATSTKQQSANSIENALAFLTGSKNAFAESDNLFPSEMLRKLNLSGKLTIDKLTVVGMQLSKVSLPLQSQAGLLKMNPITAKLYGGSLNSVTQLNVRGRTPRIDILNKLSHLQIEPLLSDSTGVKNFSGIFNGQTKLSTQGQSVFQLRRNLNGTADFALTDGIWKGVDLSYEIDRATAFFKQKKAPSQSSDKTTVFSKLSGSVKFHQGIGHNDDLSLQSSALNATGKGTINVVNEKINYRLNTALHGKSLNPVTEQLQNLLGGSIPILITGRLSKPAVTPDFPAITKGLATGVFKKHLERVLPKQDTGDNIINNLKEVFN